MAIIAIVVASLVMWWIAFAILVARDKIREPGSIAAVPEPHSDAPPHPSHLPRMLSWPSRADYFAKPTLLLIVPWCVLLYAVACFLIWPAFLFAARPKR
jgi:hypothetical protein